MDRSLWVLGRLRVGALARRWKKSLSRPKGIAMAVVTALIFVPWVFSMVVSSRLPIEPPLENIRRYAPLGLFAFTVGSLLFSAGEQSLYYSPAEVTFLFAGPYRKRQLLAYKLIVTALILSTSALFVAASCLMFSPSLASAFVGSFLTLLFVQMTQMAVGLGASTLGKLAWSRGRRWVLAGVAAVVVLAVLTAGRGLAGGGARQALDRIERSPVARVVLTPFRWFILAFTAERAWPDLARWGALGAAVDGGLIALVFALDAGFLEAASASSAQRFAKLRRLGGGGGGVRSMATRRAGRFRFRPPAAPWWGGVGPNFWRQMTTALGDPGRLVGVVVMLAVVPGVMIAVAPSDPRQTGPLPYIGMGTIGWMSIVLSMLIPYDFRGDVDLMDELKALPIPPSRLALGQLLTPTLVATFSQGLALVAVMAGLGGGGVVGWSYLAFLLPVNLMFYGIENLLFLWYPSRVVAGQFDIMAVGRQMLFLLAKVTGLGLGAGLAALVGAGAYFLAGRNLPAALVASWIVMAASAIAIVPLVGRAFSQFDVTNDVPA